MAVVEPSPAPAEEAPPQVPDALRARLESTLLPGEQVRAAAEADLDLSGRFGTSWLVATDRRIAVFAVNGKPPDSVLELPLREVRAVRRRDQGGHALLEAHTEERSVPLVRFTGAQAEAVGQAVGKIRDLLRDVNGVEDEPQEEGGWARHHGQGDRHHQASACPKCHSPIPHWMGGVCPQCLDKRGLILRLLTRVKRHWMAAAGGLLLMLMLQGLDLVQPLLQKLMIDQVIPKRDVRMLGIIILGVLGIYAANAILGAVRALLMVWLGERITYDLRTDLYDHLQRLSISYYDRKETGWIMDRVTSDTGNLQDFLTDGLQEALGNIIMLIWIGLILFSVNPKLAFLTLLPAPLVVVLSSRFMHRSHRLYHWMWRKRSRISMLLSNVIPGVRVVKAFAQENREAEQFDERCKDYMNASVSATRYFATFSRTIGFVTGLGSVIVWGFGGLLVIQAHTPPQPGEMTIGGLVAFMSYLWRFYGPLQNLTRMSQRIQRAATSAQRVFEVVDAQTDVIEERDAKKLPQIRGEVEFRNVTFGYEQNNMVLKGVSFVARPGEMIGLVGPSGAGKSTTINLLCRFYDVNDGAILIDGVDIRDVTLQSLRSQIGLVLQEPFLFHGTVAENIAYGKPGAQMEEIIAAARAANAHDFILRLPEGYDSMVGERGQRLSGGERQRISIARAILKDPRILILDEATASVDTETEALIREAIERLISGRTTFAIAHRFSTLRNASRLVVLEKGRVVEQGSHAELMANEEGLFHRLCMMQSEMSQIIAVGG